MHGTHVGILGASTLSSLCDCAPRSRMVDNNLSCFSASGCQESTRKSFLSVHMLGECWWQTQATYCSACTLLQMQELCVALGRHIVTCFRCQHKRHLLHANSILLQTTTSYQTIRYCSSSPKRNDTPLKATSAAGRHARRASYAVQQQGHQATPL